LAHADEEGMATKVYHKKMAVLSSVLLACSGVILSVGCGSSKGSQAPLEKALQGVLQLSPSVTNLPQGNDVRFTPVEGTITISPSRCTWNAADTAILSSKGNGEFVGVGIGSSSVTATCGGSSASSLVLVSPVSDPTAISITSGGTYSGNWSSTDPKIPAVTILTNEPVVIRNSTLSGRGDLIIIYGRQGGADVTIDNVTGTALDPGVAGVARGKFLGAENVSRLSVTHCTMHGVSFGVFVAASPTLESLTIKDNVADNLDDRKSDGNSGYLLNQRVLGHFIQISGTYSLNGGEIAWNQMINLDGKASIEDLLSFYQGRGATGKTFQVHDNYLEGAFATGQTTPYTGTGVQMDGNPNDPSSANAFVQIYNNTIVHLAGSGISIAAGHDISVTGNRIVSCGKDISGNWIAGQGSTALVMLNYYQMNQYFNNYMANNSGGLVTPDANGNPQPGDVYAPSASKDLDNVVGTNVFEQPCLARSSLNLAAESIERNRWLNAVAAAGELLGDQH
jgi:hypothetical protein